MKLRILSMVLSILILLTLVACGGGNVTSDDDVSGESQVDSTVSDVDSSDVPEDLTSSDVPPEGDASNSGDNSNTTTAGKNNNKVTNKTTAGKTNSQGSTAGKKLFDKPITFTVYMQEHANQPILVDSMKWGVLKEATNVTLDVDIGTGSTHANKLAAAAASGVMYDITFMNISYQRTMRPALFMDVTNIMKTKLPNYYNLVKDDMSGLSLYRIGGKYLGLAQLHYNGYTNVPLNVAIRYDILDKHGLKVPTTWNEWFDTMLKLKKAYPNSKPYSNRVNEYILEYMSHALGQQYNLHYDYKQGKYVCGAMESRFRQVLQFMIRCYENGIIDPDFYTATNATYMNAATNNLVFFNMDNGSSIDEANRTLQEKNPQADFSSMPLMTNLFGEKAGKMYTEVTNYASQYCLSAATKEPEKLLKFMNWCYSKEAVLINSYGGKEGVTYEVDKKGTPYVPKKVWSKYMDSATPAYAWMSDLGIGQLCFAPLYENQNMIWKGSTEVYKDPELEQEEGRDCYSADMKAGKFTPLTSSISPDVDMTIMESYQNINQYMKVQMYRFMSGKRALSDYNNFVAELKKMGVEKILAACNK